MSDDLPQNLGADGIRLMVVRNDQQFQHALQDITVMVGKTPVAELMQTNADAARRSMPAGMMGVFIIVPPESPNFPVQSTFSPTHGEIEILHTPKPFSMPLMLDYALMPKSEKPLQLVTQSDAGQSMAPAAIFEITGHSLTGRQGADPMQMLAELVMGALTASAQQRGGTGDSRMRPPAGIDLLAQLMGDDGAGQATLWDKKNAQDTVKLGRGLMREYPNTMFCGVGNSPSYLIYAMEKAAVNDNKPVEVRYIPFSGRFLERGRPKNGALVYSEVDQVDFSRYQYFKNAYRTRLDGMGLSPTAIVARHEDHSTRTAFIDNTQSGTSFMSFNTIMRLWARDQGVEKEFKSAAPVIALADSDCRVAPVNGHVSIPAFNIDLTAQVVRIPHALRLAMNSNLSDERDRFVPEYPFEAWGRPPADLGRVNKETIAQVKALIDETVAESTASGPVRGIGKFLDRLRHRGSSSDPRG